MATTTDPAPDLTPDIAALRRELAGLRREIALLRDERAATPRLRLAAARHTALLGQRIAVSAEVADGRGAPLSGRSVTLAATAGGLRRPGSLAPAAAALAFVTDDDGFARAELASTLDHALGVDERVALEVALGPLLAPLVPTTHFDPNAPATGDALLDLARRYRLHGNLALQSAIDACFRTADAPRTTGGDSGGAGGGTGGGGQVASVWRTVPVALLGQVSDGAADEPSAVIAGAVLSVAFYDWRGPFLEALRALARAESTLPRQLLAERKGADAEGLPGRLYDRVRRFVSDQRGEVGQAVARGHAEEALVGFLDRGAADLSVDQRRTLFPALALGSSALAVGATTTLAVVGQARTDLKKVIDRRPNVDLGPIVDRLGAAEAAILVKADRRALDDALSGVQDRFEAETAARGDLKTALATETGARTELAAMLDAEAAARAALATALQAEARARAGLANLVATKADAAQIADLRSRTEAASAQIGTIQTSIRRIDADIANLRPRPPIIGPTG